MNLSATIAELEKLDDPHLLWHAFLIELKKMGIDFAIYLTMDINKHQPFLLTNIPQIYDLIDIKQDPFFAYCCNSYEPMFTGIEFAHNYEFLEALEVDFILKASQLTGFKSGVALPMRLVGSKRMGGFNLGTKLSKNAFNKFIKDKMEQLRFLCLIVHRRMEELSDNKKPINPDFRTRLLAPQANNFMNHMPKLSPREQEIIYLFSQGFTTKECAKICHISPNTVAEYTKSAYKKLKARNRITAIKTFIEYYKPNKISKISIEN